MPTGGLAAQTSSHHLQTRQLEEILNKPSLARIYAQIRRPSSMNLAFPLPVCLRDDEVYTCSVLVVQCYISC